MASLVNGSARVLASWPPSCGMCSRGYLYHYAFAMIIGLSALLAWLLTRIREARIMPAVWRLLSLTDLAADRGGAADPHPRRRRRRRSVRWIALVASPADAHRVRPALAQASTARAPRSSSPDASRGSTAFHSDYYLGVDGISMPLIVLTPFMTAPVVIAGWTVIEKRPAQYFAAFLIMEGLMIGVFCGAGRAAVLRVLGSDADPDVHHHRRLGRPAARLRDHQVLPVHVPRLRVHAGRADLPVRARAAATRSPTCRRCRSRIDRAAADLLRLPARVRGEGADVCRCTPGCRTRTSKRRPAARSSWPRSC